MKRPEGRDDRVPAALRRLALKHQGLLGRRGLGSGLGGSLKALTQLGYVQIDTISVVARAHHHTLWARVGRYDDTHLNRLVERGDAFEYWFHAAAYLPMRDYRFALPRMRAIARGEERWGRTRNPKLLRYVMDRIRAEGALRARDFEAAPRNAAGWWDWKPAKRALEELFMQGDLMSAGRDGFQKRYDLTERVLPSDVDTREPTLGEYADYLIDTTLTAHGFATAKAMTYGRRGNSIRKAVSAALDDRVGDGRLVTLELRGDTLYAAPETLDVTPKKPAPAVRILSPFDNSIIQRQRTQAVHAFDYQLECYVPEGQRRFGYYCLPILYGDRFVGRMDCKAHRDRGVFEIKRLHLERPVDDGFDRPFADTVTRYAAYNDCTDVAVSATRPAGQRARIRQLF